jgi:hypothetical protein
MTRIDRIDLTSAPPGPATARLLAAPLAAGALVEAELLSAAEAAALRGEVLALQRAFFDPVGESYSQLLVFRDPAGRERALFNWGTGGEEGAEPVDLAVRPLLGRLVAHAVAVSDALRPDGEELMLSVVPSIDKTRTFPRFYHRDSHTSVSEVDAEAAGASCYRTVWDLGLVASSDVLDVDFVPRAALRDGDGRVAEDRRHLFQRANLDFRSMSDAEIDAVQPQMRWELLPAEGTARDGRTALAPGRAYVWQDDLFFHSTFLRRGRRIEELAAAPRSILIVREFAANAHRDIPWSPAVRRLLPL